MKASAWRPLRRRMFGILWMAALASNIGSTMHDVGAAWLMTSLTPSTVMVALMQTAASLPIFLVALPAGALADLVDRRRLLLVTQGWMLLVAAVLGTLTLAGWIAPPSLLALTFLLGLAGALNAPAWQAITPELVPRSELPAAVSLGGIGFNLARAVGPALGGLIVAAAGPGGVFLLNAASFLGVMMVLRSWRRRSQESIAPAERLVGAMRAGRRYVRHAPALHAVLVRTGVFILCGSALWALLPVLARKELHLSALGYGGLLGCFGLGAVTAASLLPKVRRKLDTDPLVAGASVLFAGAVAALAMTEQLALVYPVMAVGGAAWMTVMSTLNLAAQMAVPAWVRARALAVYLLVFQGGLAIGSVCWGAVAERAGLHTALLWASGGLVLGLAALPRFRLVAAEGLDLTPSQHWPEPIVENEPQPEQGPVLITVEYRIDPEQASAFAEAMREVGQIKRRDGAMRWGLWHDVADPGRCVETFVVESWAEHLRQHERVTMEDQAAEARAMAFHIDESPPPVAHFLHAYAAEEEQSETPSD